jgi:hypothetical protein
VAGTPYSTPPPYPPAYEDPLGSSEISDPNAALAAMHHAPRYDEEDTPAAAAVAPAPVAARKSGAPLIIGIVVALCSPAALRHGGAMRGTGTPAPETAASAVPIAAPRRRRPGAGRARLGGGGTGRLGS